MGSARKIFKTVEFDAFWSKQLPSKTCSSGLRFAKFRCKECDTHLAASSELESKHYRGRTGEAWLFKS